MSRTFAFRIIMTKWRNFFIMKSVWRILIKKSKSDIYRKEAFTVAFYLNSETGFMCIAYVVPPSVV